MIFISRRANLYPRHIRGPSKNGRKAYRSRLFPSIHLSGSNTSAFSTTLGILCGGKKDTDYLIDTHSNTIIDWTLKNRHLNILSFWKETAKISTKLQTWQRNTDQNILKNDHCIMWWIYFKGLVTSSLNILSFWKETAKISPKLQTWQRNRDQNLLKNHQYLWWIYFKGLVTSSLALEPIKV